MDEFNKRTILLVEDDAIIALDTVTQLRKKGYDLLHAPSGEKAIEMMNVDGQKIDLILMDIGLGKGMSGTESAERILKERDIPILFLYSHTETEVVEKTELITAYGFVVKNSNISILALSIETAFKLYESKLKIDSQREHFQTILLSIGNAVIATGTDGKIVVMNPIAENLLGVTYKEVAGETLNNFFNIINAQTREPVPNPVDMVLSTGKIVALADHTILISQNKTEYHIADSGSPIIDKDGNITGVVLVFRDITNDYETQRKIKKSFVDNKFITTFYDITSIKMVGKALEKKYIKKDKSIVWLDLTVSAMWSAGEQPEHRLASGEIRHVEVYSIPKKIGGQALLHSIIHDVTLRKQAELQCATRAHSMALLVSGSPLLQILESIVRGAEIENPGMIGSILLLDEIGNHLLLGTAPNLPSLLNEAIHGLAIGPNVLSCGTAAFTKKRVIVSDIESDPLWSEYKDLASKAGLAACWSEPIFGKEGRLLGTFALYHTHIAKPNQKELGCIIAGAQLAALAIERKEGEEKIQELLKEKELILSEVHHRVKNNMSTIASLLTIQADAQENQSTSNILNDAAGRVYSMSILYDKLYRSENKEKISIKGYIPSLAQEIVSLFPNAEMVKLNMHIEDIILNANVLSPFGIILNELITNSMKYAFKNKEDGLILLSISQKKNKVEFLYTDNGPGIPDSISLENPKGFGLKLLCLLVQQLRGTILIEREKGTKFEIEFPI